MGSSSCFFTLFSLFYMHSIFFNIYMYYVFHFWVPSGNFYFLSSMQHVITRPRCTFHSAILSLGHMEEELSTACRVAADALEILGNLRPGFTRNVIPQGPVPERRSKLYQV